MSLCISHPSMAPSPPPSLSCVMPRPMLAIVLLAATTIFGCLHTVLTPNHDTLLRCKRSTAVRVPCERGSRAGLEATKESPQGVRASFAHGRTGAEEAEAISGVRVRA
ncbi:hypothetical protein VTO73DRAFT_4765 [Trametes versicolor]